jgi:hypothetical protein
LTSKTGYDKIFLKKLPEVDLYIEARFDEEAFCRHALS